jgi:hypothetical protein
MNRVCMGTEPGHSSIDRAVDDLGFGLIDMGEKP